MFFLITDKMKHTAHDMNKGFHNAEILMENKVRQGAQNVQEVAANTKQQVQVRQ